jgi:hypothetical protein
MVGKVRVRLSMTGPHHFLGFASIGPGTASRECRDPTTATAGWSESTFPDATGHQKEGAPATTATRSATGCRR